MQLDQHPGFQKAIARAERQDAQRRDLAFLEMSTRIGGLPCLPLTPRHLLCLFVAESPFVCGGRVGPEHVAQFLWIVSPEFVLGDRKAARIFTARIATQVRYGPAVKKIDAILDEALADRPARKGGARTVATASFIASLVHEMGRAYGWTRGETIHTPLAVIYQQLRYIAREDNPNAPLFAGSADRVKGDLLRQRKARKEKREAKKKGTSRG